MSVITAIVIPADELQPLNTCQIASSDVDAYQRLVGGHIEAVNLDGPAASLYVNEEGKLIGLPLNSRATALAWVHNELLCGHDVLAGDAFLVGPVDQEGDDTTVPTGYLDLLFPTERLRVEVRAHGEARWATNGMEFDTAAKAYQYAVDLWKRWMQADQLRIVLVSTPRSQPFDPDGEYRNSPDQE